MAVDPVFIAKTHRELARLSSEAVAGRRFVAHVACPDDTACRHCALVRDKHRLINDHLDQLDLETAYDGSAS